MVVEYLSIFEEKTFQQHVKYDELRVIFELIRRWAFVYKNYDDQISDNGLRKIIVETIVLRYDRYNSFYFILKFFGHVTTMFH